MIYLGKNITTPNDPLVKVAVSNVWQALRNPRQETLSLIRQLRIVRAIDLKRYNVLKRQLPYLVCGAFSPSCRRSENFAYIEYFMLDIDKIVEKGWTVNELKQRFVKDERTVLCFVSPSEDGLKLLFKLEEKCYDKGLFSVFYKAFSWQFARQYGIEQVIDFQTCDVTRACFVSYDPDAYYNPNATPVSLNNYITQDNPAALFDLKKELEKKGDSENPQPQQKEAKADVDAEVIQNIKAILNPAAQKQAKKPVYVPEELNEIIDELKKRIMETGVEVTEIINISYGKKIRMKTQHKLAEVNVFYGKKGFSVVKSPRTGTDDELNDLTAELIQSIIYTLYTT